MKKNYLYLLIVLIILILLGGIGFMAMNKKSATPQIPENSTGQTQIDSTVQTENSVKSSLKDLLSKGIPQKCTYTDNLNNVDMSGISYMSGNKVRTDFNNLVEGKTVSSHMIFADNTAYNWSDGQKTGMMFKMDPNQIKDAQKDTAATNQQFDPNKVVDYKCSPWIADNSLFTPPTDVQFSDLSTMMAPKTDSNNGQQGAPNMCATCNNLSGEAKSQCLTAFKCS